MKIGQKKEFEQAIRGRKQLWIGVDKERKGFASSSYQVLGKNLQLYLSDEDEGAFLQRRFQAPYKEHFQQFKELVERSLFYEDLPLEEEDGVFNYYEPIYRVIIQGNIQQIFGGVELVGRYREKPYPKSGDSQATLYSVHNGCLSFI